MSLFHVRTRLGNGSSKTSVVEVVKSCINASTSKEAPTQTQLIVNVKCLGLAISLDILNTLCHTPLTPLLLVVSQSTIAPFPQDGWTAILLAARYGHKDLVQELCETFGADFLHRKKVRAMQTVSGSEWLRELIIYNVRTHVRMLAEFVYIRQRVTRRSEFLCVPWQPKHYHVICM